MWYNPEDVPKDLATLTNRKQKCVDRNYMVFGLNPPPPITIETEDDEFTLRFDEDTKQSENYGEMVPDLNGIKEMLKLVEEQNNPDDELEDSYINSKSNSSIIISKLNPNVNEFVPRSVTLTECDINNKINDKDLDTKAIRTDNCNKRHINSEKLDNIELNTSNVKDTNNAHISSDASILLDPKSCSSSLSEIEFKSVTDALKNKISEASKSTSYKVKREKNLAISTLLRLYTASPVNVKLMTPDDFTLNNNTERLNSDVLENGCIATETADSGSDAAKKKFSTASENIRDATSLSDIGNTRNTGLRTSSGSLDVAKKVNSTNEIIKTETVNGTGSQSIDPEVIKSIIKVSDWLEPKEKENEKASVNLGPVLFKRKASTKAPITSENKVPTDEQCYKPSVYADNLVKKYTEKIKTNQLKETKPTWNNLEQILRMKDEEIKKKKSEQSTRENSANVSVSGGS